MGEPQERRWEGRSAVSVADWVAAELERALEPSEEQRGVLSALFNTATSVGRAARQMRLPVIGHAGMNDNDATKWALTIAANILELAWVNGHEQLDAIPDVRVYYRVKDGRCAW